jgi:hypothetical protein
MFCIPVKGETDQIDSISQARIFSNTPEFLEKFNAYCNVNEAQKKFLVHNSNNLHLLNSFGERKHIETIHLSNCTAKNIENSVKGKKCENLGPDFDFAGLDAEKKANHQYDYIFEQGDNERNSEFYKCVDKILAAEGVYVAIYFLYSEPTMKKRIFDF